MEGHQSSRLLSFCQRSKIGDHHPARHMLYVYWLIKAAIGQ